tara:strand:+ start:1467 stop:8513 length:7047 start_codon:yes stop_codon:yes gene_type:complete
MSRIFAESTEKVEVSGVATSSSSNQTRITKASMGNIYAGMGVSYKTGASATTIPDNSYITSTSHSSNYVTMNNNSGQTDSDHTVIFNKSNVNVPTNPKFRTFGAYSGSERLYTIIYEQPPSATENFIQQATAGETEHSNLETTEGFRIKNFHGITDEGHQLNSLDLTTNNYFVLIHSDDHLKHHFAKITQINNNDADGDSFDFEPRLGTEIAEGTKFMVFKGPLVSDGDSSSGRNCKILAVSAGIKKDLQDSLVCSSPLFYFFNDNLDKDNQLDHNTKYFMKFKGETDTGTSLTNKTREPSFTNTFVSVSDFQNKIKDYSKFSMNISLNDNLKTIDSPDYYLSGNAPLAITNEFANGETLGDWTETTDFTDYNECFPNARRDTDNDVFNTDSLDTLGPIRYIHYDFSPTKANKLYNVIDMQLEESIGSRGSYAETKAIDTKRILPVKVNNFDDLRIRHRLHKGKFNDWFALKAFIKARVGTTNEYTFTTEYDLRTMFNTGDEVKIGDIILIVDTIDIINNSGASGKEQDITFRAETRPDNSEVAASKFASSSYVLTENAVIYRRAWNSVDSTLLTSFDIIENRNNNLYVKLVSGNFGFLEATVTASDKNKEMLTLDFTTTNRSISSLDYMEGSYYIEVEKFSGSIEKTAYYKENGQTILDISGRSDIRKLLGPIVNKNTLHSQDIIYSSRSPYQTLGGTGITDATITSASFASNDIVVANLGGALTTADAGMPLFAKTTAHGHFGYLGILGSVASNTITLKANSLMEITDDAPTDSSMAYNYTLVYGNSKHYMFNKAMSANTKTNTVSSLGGASSKGLYFNGGYSLSTFPATTEDVYLPNTSANTVNAESVGYYFTGVKGIEEGSVFEGRLDDNAQNTGTKQFTTFDTVNTLLDFTVIGISEDNNETVIELAPYIPLTLGRVDINYANMFDTDLYSTDLGKVNASTIGNNYFTVPATGTGSSTESLSSTATQRKYHGKPIYASTTESDDLGTVTYLGKLIQADLNEAADTITIYVSKQLESDIDDLYIRALTYQTDGETSHKTHEMNFLNGAHLHSGKTIIKMHPNKADEGVLGKVAPFNFSFFQSTATEEISYIDKYGSPHYCLFNIEKGNFNKTTEVIATDPSVSKYYGEESSKIKYYSNAYRGVGATDLVYHGKTGKNAADNHILPESRGWTNAAGSKFFEQKVTKSGGSPEKVAFYKDPTDISSAGTGRSTPFAAVDNLNLIDPKIARMFLFVNGDVMGYSSKRRDSLLKSNRTIKDYNLMLLREPSIVDFSDNKEEVYGATNNLNLTDSSYTSLNISSCDTDISQLKRFSIMRLTEMVVDFAFNQIDPEDVPKKDRTFSQWYYPLKMPEQLDAYFSSNNVAVSNYISNAITLDSNPAGGGFVSGDFIFDDNGRYVGTISGTSTTGSTPAYKIDLSDGPIKTNGNAFFTGRLHKVYSGGNRTAKITGHGKGDTFARFQNQIHMMKTMVARRVGENATDSNIKYYGEDGTAFEDTYDNDLGSAPTGNSHRDPNLWLPINMDENSLQSAKHTVSSGYALWPPSKVFHNLSRMKDESNSNDCTAEELLYKGMLPLFLDRFKVENADGAEASKGMVGQPIMGSSIRTLDVASHDHFACISMKTQFDFAKWEDSTLTTNSHAAGKTADGVLMGFKPRLYINEDADFELSSVQTDGTAGSGGFGNNPKIIQVGSTATLKVGMKVTGHAKIPANSVITQIDSATLFRINNDVGSGTLSTTATFDTRKNQVGGFSTYNYVIDIDEAIATTSLLNGSSTAEGNISRLFLDVINDLTGCYLVGEKGKYYDENGAVATYSDSHITNPSLNGQTPNVIAYVLSHEIDTTNSNLRHIITTNAQLPTDWYRIMQPNHTCLYSYSPKDIRLNELSSRYTKINGENACYTDINDYTLVESAGERTLGNSIGTGASAIHNNTGGQEAALSMYVAIDIEEVAGSSSNTHVITDPSDYRKAIAHSSTAGQGMDANMILSDGEKTIKSAVSFTDNSDDIGFFLNFENLQEMLGVVSVSESFTLTVNDEVSGQFKRALIGTGVTICNESEDLINTLMEENDIEFTSTAAEYPLFLAPNYQGIDLFSAVNSLLTKKDKVLFHDNNTFQIKDRNDASFDTGILIKDTGDTEIYDYEKATNMFDLYNEIIVYGKNTKSIRRHPRTINQFGKRTLEVYDSNLVTLNETDTKALELLKLHTDLNEKITVTVGHKKVSQLRSGDIVELEIARENIHRNKYLVLQVKHLLQGNMKLELGRYSKQLEDRFAEIAIEQRNVRADTRNTKFDDSSVFNTFIEDINIKPIRLLVRERKSNGGATLGFGTTLNTTVRPLGHTGGLGVTITDLVEEEY